MKGEDSIGVPALAVLELLAQDSPPSRFHEVFQSAQQQQSLSSDHLSELQRATHLALDIQASVSQRRRRETFMTGLVDTVRDMTLPSSPDTLLKVVTSRARRLLGFDMAYVSLRDADDNAYIHSSDGDSTALNTGLVVQKQRGLSELVRTSGAPFWSTDYLNDDRIPHWPEVDDVVRAEGLSAIMAVPILRASETIGVLYGANRVVRHFTPDEISVMRSLADFASVALEKAELLDRTRTQVAALESLGAQSRATVARLTDLGEAQTRLTAMVLDGSDLQQLATAAAEMLAADVTIGDAYGQVLGSSQEARELGEVMTTGAVLEAQAAGGPILLSPGVWGSPVSAGAENLGLVVMLSDTEPDTDTLRYLRYVGHAVAVLLVIQRSTAVAAGPVRDEFLDELLAVPLRLPHRLASRAQRLQVDLEEPYVIVIVRPEGGEHGKAVVWGSSYSHRHRGLKTVRDGRIVLLLPGTDASAAARTVSEELSRVLTEPATVGAAGPATGLTPASELHLEAQRCLDTLIVLGETGSSASMSDLGFLGLLLSDDRDVDGFVASAVGPLLKQDAERGTTLIGTVETYFASGQSPTRAAEALYIHANTVARRLDRITDLLGPGWQKGERAVEVQLALRLLRARGVLRRQRETTLGTAPRSADSE
ncbi:CdaR family transcriptional regulator [Streptomyces spiroverticillatus]|uniref:CdaR family transcriptional regulator n=1 Tax=Streptomyces finlayi TaxID=67296 RepID=A0A919C8E6_9ACTN|nr:helix-turn-helix domain-containing protein [Streptomyces finlayi]GHA01153.1 CdaR family transcriptional regulator [Streptomyces spiroverticillatus]GHC85605.1 CdaR family transcriptional regulator [Streptomyces finlayi]